MLLLTGGAGYIGAHIAIAAPNTKIVVYDNFSHAPFKNIDAIRRYNPNIRVVEGDVTDRDHLMSTATRFKVNRIIHCAGLKSIPEGERKKSLYTRVNVEGTKNVVSVAEAAKVQRLIFSSSAAVYAPSMDPLTEDSPLGPVSHYGRTKLMAEGAIRANPKVSEISTILRYFNPVGCTVVPDLGVTNLACAMVQAARTSSEFPIFGDQYPTPDGSAVRDYILVDDLARIHSAMLLRKPGTFNVGYGIGYSVKEMVELFQRSTGRYLRAAVHPPRAGDSAFLVADPGKLLSAAKTHMPDRHTLGVGEGSRRISVNIATGLYRQWEALTGEWGLTDQSQ
jgi:UDP-glucose 4-epimerase